MRRRSVVGALGVALTLSGCTAVIDGPSSEQDTLDASGTIVIELDGEPFDLSQDRFQAENVEDVPLAFHLHEGDDQWYMEGQERVTLGTAIDLLPHFAFDADEAGRSITIDNRTYDQAADGTEITFLIDGTEVDPTTYRLQDGDAIRINIRTNE